MLRLGEEQQQLVCLRFFQQLSYEEIAPLVGKGAGSVRVTIHRALRKLRPTLQRALDDQYVWEDSDGR